MAYVLGFWFADGYICENKGSLFFSIAQHKKDKFLMKNILKAMRSNNPLYKHGKNSFSFVINSKDIFNDIVNIGGKERKSLDVDFPSIPKRFLPSFVRGYWDGDGSIFRKTQRKCYKSVCVSGSRKFIYKMRSVLSKNISNFYPKIYEQRSKINNNIYYRLTLNHCETKKLGLFMYNGELNLHMKRKYTLFKKVL